MLKKARLLRRSQLVISMTRCPAWRRVTLVILDYLELTGWSEHCRDIRQLSLLISHIAPTLIEATTGSVRICDMPATRTIPLYKSVLHTKSMLFLVLSLPEEMARDRNLGCKWIGAKERSLPVGYLRQKAQSRSIDSQRMEIVATSTSKSLTRR